MWRLIWLRLKAGDACRGLASLVGFHRDERGDNENLGRLLLLALILIPLILLIAIFGGEIYDAAQKAWKEVMKTDVKTKKTP